MDSLSAMSLFVRVAASGSHAEAGRLLGMSAAAVGQSVAAMEARLAVPLFEPDALAVPAKHLRLTPARSEEHTSELQSHHDIVCRLLLEKKKNTQPLWIDTTIITNNTNYLNLEAVA